MGGLLGGLHVIDGHFAAINSAEEVDERLNRLNARVLARPIDELSNEAQSNSGMGGDGFKTRCARFSQTTLEVIRDRFNVHGHTEYRFRFDCRIPFTVLQEEQCAS